MCLCCLRCLRPPVSRDKVLATGRRAFPPRRFRWSAAEKADASTETPIAGWQSPVDLAGLPLRGAHAKGGSPSGLGYDGNLTRFSRSRHGRPEMWQWLWVGAQVWNSILQAGHLTRTLPSETASLRAHPRQRITRWTSTLETFVHSRLRESVRRERSGLSVSSARKGWSL